MTLVSIMERQGPPRWLDAYDMYRSSAARNLAIVQKSSISTSCCNNIYNRWRVVVRYIHRFHLGQLRSQHWHQQSVQQTRCQTELAPYFQLHAKQSHYSLQLLQARLASCTIASSSLLDGFTTPSI